MNYLEAFFGILGFFVLISCVAWIVNYILLKIGSYLGWFTKPLVKDHWWDKYTNKMWVWYNNEREKFELK